MNKETSFFMRHYIKRKHEGGAIRLKESLRNEKKSILQSKEKKMSVMNPTFQYSVEGGGDSVRFVK